jgi:hypothetical protein
LTGTICAQKDTLRKTRRVTPIVFSGISYQLAVNGNKAETDLGNFGFKGYVQPEIGLGIKYQQDTTEFATVGLSATRFVFTLASANILYDNGNEYPIVNRMDIYMNNFALTTAYHRRLTHKSQSHFWSLEVGAGVHFIQWYGTVRTDDTQVGPYAATHAVNTPKNFYALPSTSVGLNCSLLSREHKTSFLFGINSEMYLAKFDEIQYSARYASANTTLNYSFRWAPMILAPKVYVMAMF